MTQETLLLITAPPPQLLADIARDRPDWQVIPLDDPHLHLPAGANIWGFIDWLCPTMSGLEFCRRLRQQNHERNLHLTLVLDANDLEARRRAIQAGADDYVTSPLDIGKLLERVDRSTADSSPARLSLTNGPISIDAFAHKVRVSGNVVPLGPNEFQLLVHFMENRDRVFTRTALIEKLSKGTELDERTVDVWIGRLRRSIIKAGAADPIRTVRTVGYVMDSV